MTRFNGSPCPAPAGYPLPPEPAPGTITGHEGHKYLRTLRDPVTRFEFQADVYAVLKGYGVTCPAVAHAVKKLLCAGQRGKGDRLADLRGALAAVSRAIELEEGVPHAQ